MKSFWDTLPDPFFVLAPMADVTDPAYRRLIAETTMPDVMWTEFVSADGLYHTREKKGILDNENPLMRDLEYDHALERPIVAQLFSSNPEMMEYASILVRDMGFDGVDINMGCPDRGIEKQGCGAGMIKDPGGARAVIKAAKKSGLPVSVKTRIGYNSESIDEWISVLLEEELAALTVHLRTRKEMSLVPAHWELMPRIVSLRDKLSPHTKIIGNGDVQSIPEARVRVDQAGCDGAMLGRAIFGNPWLFSDRSLDSISKNEKLIALQKLSEYFDELHPYKSFHILKKHIKAFIIGYDGAHELRHTLMEATTGEELRKELARHVVI